ncbi:MAG: winged helix-turn-helix domain-containing protein [Halobacteriovoraceae bacterium]|nr:winged helix-turn-helix domain-containing protein [Halobacteriovoraceae bacterium]
MEGLTLKQQRILEVLKFKRTTGVSREVLLSLVWGNQVVVPKNIDVHITEMRRILKNEGLSIVRNGGRWFLRSSGKNSDLEHLIDPGMSSGHLNCRSAVHLRVEK